ncbi:MAG: aminotransferase class IV [Myxococcales bacterium]|nr:aminotransferase class IV [Myxococcales bacterium]
MSPVAVSIDGVVVEPATASISVFDRGLLFGDGCFEVLRTWHGHAVELEAHLDRLGASAATLQLRMLSRTELTAAVERTLAAAGEEGEHRIRIVVTRGPGGLAAETASLGPGRAIVIVEPLGAQPTELSAAIVDWPLAPRRGPAHKTLAYLDHVIARDLARAAGADEAIRLGADGRAVEGATSTLYAVLAGTVVTPPLTSGILPGIVRERVLAACATLAIPLRESTLAVAELRGADEIFASSSLRGVVPITRLDGVPRAAGPITVRIATAVSAALGTRVGSAASDRRPG